MAGPLFQQAREKRYQGNEILSGIRHEDAWLQVQGLGLMGFACGIHIWRHARDKGHGPNCELKSTYKHNLQETKT